MKRRTRLFVLGDWTTPVFDSDTSDMHPVDYLLYGPHRELNVVVDIGEGPGRFRWSGVWSQVSRRKYTEHVSFGEIERLLSWPEIHIPPVQIPAALVRDIPEPTEEERRRSLRYQPVTEALAGVIADANLTLTVNRDELLDGAMAAIRRSEGQQ